jgi:serine phosphatase RsbU (regulator of sigma subunit)
VLAAFALGRDAALLCGALAAALSVVVPILSPGTDVSTSAQIVGGVFRTVVFVGLAALVSSLIERAADLRRRLTDAEEDVRELESLRAALISPELPTVDGLTIATSYTPADGPAAGDFFLIVPAASDTLLAVVGDVIGHGLAAARRASFVRATLAVFAEYTNDPMAILRLVNTAIAEREPGTQYVTALCAIFARDRSMVTLASAGHPPPWDLDHAEGTPADDLCLVAVRREPDRAAQPQAA